MKYFQIKVRATDPKAPIKNAISRVHAENPYDALGKIHFPTPIMYADVKTDNRLEGQAYSGMYVVVEEIEETPKNQQ